MTELARLRGRLAYWEKRIELEKTERKRQQLEIFAVAELARAIVREGMRVYGVLHGGTFEDMVQQQFRIERQAQRVETATSQVFAAHPRRPDHAARN